MSVELRKSLAVLGVVASVACAGGGGVTPAARGGPGGTEATSGGAAPTTAPPPLTHLNVVYSTTSASTAILTLGQQHGIYAENGIEVELSHAPGNAGPAALVAGQVQAMLGGCAEMLSAVAGGADQVLLLVTNNRVDYILTGGPNIPNRESVRGKTLGVSRFGASSHIISKYMVRQLGLDPDRDVSFLQVGNTPERIASILSGGIDGAALTVDEGQLIQGQEGIHVVVDMTQENAPWCGNGLIVMRSQLRDNRDLDRRLTKAVVEMMVRFKANKAEGVAAVSEFMGERDTGKAELVWETRARVFPQKPYPNDRGLQFVLDESAAFDDRVRSMTVEQLTEPAFVRELDESGFIDGLYAKYGTR